MTERRLVAAATAQGFRLKRGELLRIIDIEGSQTGDLVAFSQDGRERLSNGRTFDYAGKIYLSTGDTLWSDRSNPMLTIVHDDVGRHDFLYSPCSIEMYRMQHGTADAYPNCHDNLLGALRALGITPDALTTAFNYFMKADVLPDGQLKVMPPLCRAGDSLVLRAEMDLAVALSACPSTTCNGGTPPKPVAFEISSGAGPESN